MYSPNPLAAYQAARLHAFHQPFLQHHHPPTPPPNTYYQSPYPAGYPPGWPTAPPTTVMSPRQALSPTSHFGRSFATPAYDHLLPPSSSRLANLLREAEAASERARSEAALLRTGTQPVGQPRPSCGWSPTFSHDTSSSTYPDGGLASGGTPGPPQPARFVRHAEHQRPVFGSAHGGPSPAAHPDAFNAELSLQRCMDEADEAVQRVSSVRSASSAARRVPFSSAAGSALLNAKHDAYGPLADGARGVHGAHASQLVTPRAAADLGAEIDGSLKIQQHNGSHGGVAAGGAARMAWPQQCQTGASAASTQQQHPVMTPMPSQQQPAAAHAARRNASAGSRSEGMVDAVDEAWIASAQSHATLRAQVDARLSERRGESWLKGTRSLREEGTI